MNERTDVTRREILKRAATTGLAAGALGMTGTAAGDTCADALWLRGPPREAFPLPDEPFKVALLREVDFDERYSDDFDLSAFCFTQGEPPVPVEPKPVQQTMQHFLAVRCGLESVDEEPDPIAQFWTEKGALSAPSVDRSNWYEQAPVFVISDVRVEKCALPRLDNGATVSIIGERLAAVTICPDQCLELDLPKPPDRPDFDLPDKVREVDPPVEQRPDPEDLIPIPDPNVSEQSGPN